MSFTHSTVSGNTSRTDRSGAVRAPQYHPRPGLGRSRGPTLTHALVSGSPAIDAIPHATQGCGTSSFNDQRGQARPQPAGGACDIGAFEVAVAGQPLGAWVIGLNPRTVACKNLTTTQEVTINDHATAWNCEAAGLQISAGERVAMVVRGTVAANAPDVGGATAGSCVAAGLIVHPGHLLQLRVQGDAE